jgi:hypothetical protein
MHDDGKVLRTGHAAPWDCSLRLDKRRRPLEAVCTVGPGACSAIIPKEAILWRGEGGDGAQEQGRMISIKRLHEAVPRIHALRQQKRQDFGGSCQSGAGCA